MIIILSREDETPSSTSTAATLPLPGMRIFLMMVVVLMLVVVVVVMVVVVMMSVVVVVMMMMHCITGVMNIAYIGDGASDLRKPGGTNHSQWLEVKICHNQQSV